METVADLLAAPVLNAILYATAGVHSVLDARDAAREPTMKPGSSGSPPARTGSRRLSGGIPTALTGREAAQLR
jgi:hypothetical protein